MKHKQLNIEKPKDSVTRLPFLLSTPSFRTPIQPHADDSGVCLSNPDPFPWPLISPNCLLDILAWVSDTFKLIFYSTHSLPHLCYYSCSGQTLGASCERLDCCLETRGALPQGSYLLTLLNSDMAACLAFSNEVDAEVKYVILGGSFKKQRAMLSPLLQWLTMFRQRLLHWPGLQEEDNAGWSPGPATVGMVCGRELLLP